MASNRHLLLPALVLGLISLIQAKSAPNLRIDLKGRSFMLESIVSPKFGTSYEVSEFHSAWQKRSKLTYNKYEQQSTSSIPIDATSTVYATEQATLMVSPHRYSCTYLEKNWLDHLLNNNLLQDFDSGHLIGTARLLLFIEKHFDKLTRVPETSDNIERATDGLEYTGTLPAGGGGGGQFIINLYYDLDLVNRLPYGIPRRIIIVTASFQLVEYEIKRHKELWNDKLQLGSSSKDISINRGVSGAVNSIEFDIFSLTRAIGCGAGVQNSQRDLEALVKADKFRFSFNARPETVRGLGPIDLTVAYEPQLAVLRLDRVQPTRIVSTITDYENNRKFHMVRKRAGAKQDVVFDRIASANPNSRSCVASRVKAQDDPLEYRKNPLTLGRMLFGTTRLFYLGLAYVRGIEARVYESDNCDWPIWLEQPAIYEEELVHENLNPSNGSTTTTKATSYSKTVIKMRDEAKIIKHKGFSLTNVFYFSNQNAKQQVSDEDFQLDASKLLLVEVFTRIDRTGAILARRLFPIYDFAWDLPSLSSAAGERYEDLFSLKDDCLAEMDDNEQATINLLLEAKLTPDENKLAWLQERSKRNLALISMAQSELLLMSTMIYDIESRLLVVDDDPKLNDPLKKLTFKLEVSLQAAQRSKAIARLIYAGRAFLKKSRVEMYMAFNFEMCHMLAAHQKRDTIFAFEAPEYACYLLKSDAKDDLDTIMMNTFTFADRGTKEVFKILHMNKVYLKSDDYINRLIVSRNRMNKMNGVLLFDPTAPELATDDSNVKIPFQFTSFQMDALNDEMSYELDSLHWSGVNKLPGFGLDPTSGQWFKRVTPKFISDPDTKNYHQETMSFELCQTACLADSNCRSYSLCLRGGTMQCTLSSVAFATPKMISQLMQLADKKSNFGDKFRLKLDSNEQIYISTGLRQQTTDEASEQFVEVIKHPACELHNKIFRNLFVRTLRSQMVQANSITQPVANLERCAELCYDKTLEFMRLEARRLVETKDANFERNHLDRFEEICDHFHFADHKDLVSKNAKKAEQMEKLFAGSEKNLLVIGGYCIIPGQPAAKQAGSNADNLLKEWLRLSRYDFDYLSLYAKQKGVSLAQSQRSLDEELAFTMIGKNAALSRPLVIRQDENFGTIQSIQSNAGECARRCFDIKSRAAFPVCRSFDFIEKIQPDQSVLKFCAFHSVTLNWCLGRERFDLIKHGSDRQQLVSLNPGESARVTHYEPREGIAAQTLDEYYKIELANDLMALRRQIANSPRLYMRSMGLFCTIILALTLGGSVGFVLGAKLLKRLATDRDLRESLVVEQLDEEPKEPAIKFSNLVNSEGKIVGLR